MLTIRDDLAIGLRWTTYETKAVAQRALKGTTKLLVAGKMNRQTYSLGVQEGELPYFGKPMYSAALAIADVFENFIIYHPYHDDLVWFCAVSNGEPLTDLDTLCTPRQAEAHLADMRSTLTNPTIIGEHPLATLPLVEVMDMVAKPSKLCRVHSMANQSRTRMAGLVGLLLLVAGVVGYGAIGNSSEENQAAIQAAQDALSQQKRAEAEAARLRKVAELTAAARASAMDAINSQQLWRVWHDFIVTTPISRHGWSADAINCTIAQCGVTWKRKMGVLPSTVKLLPGTLVPGDTKDSAVTNFPIVTPPIIHPNTQPGDIANYVADLAVLKSGVTWAFGPLSNDIRAPIPADMIKDGETPAIIAREGTLTVSSTSMLSLSHAMTRIDLPGVSLNTMAVSGFKGGVTPATITVTGAYRAVYQ